jgi:hypothetical protein
VLAIDSSNLVHVWYGQASGLPLESTMTPMTEGSALNFLGVGDFNSDGHGDVAAMGKGTQSVYVFFGATGGLATTAVQVAIGNVVQNNEIAVGDLNGDGRADFMVLKNTSPLTLAPFFATCM